MKRTATYVMTDLDCRLTVLVGDLFEQEGTKVVHCPSSFETSFEVIRKNSVVGQFVTMCKDKGVALDKQIDNWCKRIERKGRKNEEYQHRNILFPAGELCPVVVDGEEFCLASFCDSDSMFSTSPLTMNEYLNYWDNIWKNMQDLALETTTVSVAVPGGRYVTVGSGSFTLEQKLGVAVRSFYRAARTSCKCRELRICIPEDNAKDIDFDIWEKGILPYLYQMACMPLEWVGMDEPAIKAANKSVKEAMAKKVDTDASSLFLADLHEMIENLEKCNGHEYEQFDGSKRLTVKVDVDTDGLKRFADELADQRRLIGFLGKRKGNRYDKNKMFQLIGILHENSNYFGELNRRSVVKLSLGADDDVPERWDYLGDNIGNIINYVGQRLSDLRRNTFEIYSSLINIIPENSRRN